MAIASAALGCIASSSLAITTSQVSSLHNHMEAVSASSSVFRPRAAIAMSSSFLGAKVACYPAPKKAVNCSGLNVCTLNVRASGRMTFTPFGLRFTPYSGRGSNGRRECTPYFGGGGYGRREWERRNRFRDERARVQREMLLRLLKMFNGQLLDSSQNRDMALLRELEKRLRAKAGRQDGATEQSDIDEVMKNLKERLRPEKQSDENETTENWTMYDYLNAWLKRWDQTMKEERESSRERLQKQWDEADTTQQPEQSSELHVKSEDSSSTLKERQDEVYTPEELDKAEIEAKWKVWEEEQKKAVADQAERTEDSSPISEHQDEVSTPKELEEVEEVEKRKLLEEAETLEKAVAEQAEKIEHSSSTLTERQDQVYTPEELQKAEEEEKRKLLEEEERKKAASAEQAESEEVEEDTSNTVVHLKNEANGAQLYLVGVLHVSQESANEVRDVIRKVQPNYVMVELDRKRYNALMRRESGPYDPLNAFVQRTVKTLANDNIGMVGKVLDLFFSSFYQLLALRGLRPGQELEVAIEEGKQIGAKIVLGDQDDDTTMQRFGEQLSMTDLLQFLLPPPEDIKQRIRDATSRAPGDGNSAERAAQMFEMFDTELRDRKLTRRLNEEMTSRAPAFYKVLVSERNEVMTKALRTLSGKVVAVVGLGHLDGIEQLWREANEKYLNETE